VSLDALFYALMLLSSDTIKNFHQLFRLSLASKQDSNC